MRHFGLHILSRRTGPRVLLALAVTILLVPSPLGLSSRAPLEVTSAAQIVNHSGERLPQGDLPGWHQVFVDDFSVDVPLGTWPGSYGKRWTTYPNGWPDSAGKSGKESEYRPSRVLSVADGMLDYWPHTEHGKTLAAVVVPTAPNGGMLYQLYGRYVVRFRADPVPGYKAAFLLWPQSEIWPQDGEIDFPEGNLTATIDAYLHFQGATRGTDQAHFPTSSTYGNWHTAVIEWTPEAVTFLLDGESVGRSTQRIPASPMRWTLQIERCLDGCAAPSDAAGHVQIDWVAQYSYDPNTLTVPATAPDFPAVVPAMPTPTVFPVIPAPTPGDGMPAPGRITLARAEYVMARNCRSWVRSCGQEAFKMNPRADPTGAARQTTIARIRPQRAWYAERGSQQ